MYDYQNTEEIFKERLELESKREKLGEFKMSWKFTKLSWQEQELLNTYGHTMTMLSGILSARITALWNAQIGEDAGAITQNPVAPK